MLSCIIRQILFYSFNCILKIHGRNIPFCNYRKIKKLWLLNIFHDLNKFFSSFGFINYRKEETIGFVYLPYHKNIKTIRSNIFFHKINRTAPLVNRGTVVVISLIISYKTYRFFDGSKHQCSCGFWRRDGNKKSQVGNKKSQVG